MRKILFTGLWVVFAALMGCIQTMGQNACFTVNSASACADLPIITFNSSCSSGANFCWDFGDGSTGSTLANPTYSYNVGGPGTYTVTLNVCDDPDCLVNCDTKDTIITIFALPVASFTQTATEGCAPFEVCFTDNSTPGDAPINQWNWTFGDGGFDNSGTPSPCYIYPPTSNSSPYSVSLQVLDTNGCSDTVVMSNLITNWAIPAADFTISPNLGGNPVIVACHPGDLVTFSDASIPGDTTIASWEWDFGDSNTGTGSTATNTYTASGTYNVDLYIMDENGCKDTITKTIRIDDFQAGFTAITLEGCGNLIATFLDTTSTFQGTNLWAWDFSYDGVTFNTESTSGPNVGYYYSSPGTYTVAMVSVSTNLNGDSLCTDTAFNTAFITIHPMPIIGIAIDTNVACDYPFTVTFTSLTAGAAFWEWDVDNKPGDPWSPDGTAQTFSHTYTDTGCYNVTLRVIDTNGCADTLKIDDLICITKPIAEFIADTIMDTSDLQQPLIAEGCIPLKVHFFDLSIYDTTLINDSIVSWYWNFGDSNALDVPYTIFGGDSAIPDSTNDCLTYCTYRNPTHIYVDTGSFTVTLAITTSKGCTDTITMSQTAMCLVDNGPCTVDAGMVPFVDFTVSDTVGCHPFSTEFADLSSSFANEWAWDFGDGGTDVIQNPPYTYQSDIGFFDVSLIAKFNGCESEMLIKDSLIEVLAPRPEFTLKTFKDSLWTDDQHFCYEDSLLSGGWRVQIRDTSKGPPDVWVWDLGDTNTTKAIDTTFYVYYDTLFVDAYTAIFPPDTFFFKAGDTITCDTTFEAYYPADILTFDADTVPPVPSKDTVHITGDLMHWYGMEIDTDIIDTGQIIIIYEYCIIPEKDTLVDSTFTIVMSEQYDTTQVDTTLFGCNNEIITPYNVDTLPSYNIVTPYGLDTLYYIPHDNVSIDTIQTIYFPDTICFTRRDTITDTTSIPSTIIIGGTDTFNIAWSQILIDTTTYIIPADTNFYGIDTVPPDTTMPDTTFVPADTIMSGMCDTLYIPEDTIIDPPDTLITDSMWKAHPFVHTYHTPGTKTIWLYTWKECPTCPDSLCVDSTSRTIYISKIDAEFTINALTGGDTSKCANQVPPYAGFLFEDVSTSFYNIDYRIWDFGDGFIVSNPTPIFINSAIIPNPQQPSSCQPAGSTQGNYNLINHIYCNPGTYTVKMILIDEFGCADSVMHQVVVNPLPAPQIVTDTSSGCTNDPILGNLAVTFTDTVNHPSQIDYWVWNYGDGSPIDTTYIPVTQPHTYATCNTFAATLTAVNLMGCKNQSPAVTLITTTCPTASFVPLSTSVCSGDPLTFISNSSPNPNNLTYTWDWCDSTAMIVDTSATSAIHPFNVDTTTDFRVTLTVTDENGCRDTTSWLITVVKFDALAIVDSNVSCNGLTDGGATAFAVGGTTPYTFNWSNGGNTATITGLASGTYMVTITDSNGCTDSTSVTLTAPNALSVSATGTDPTICAATDGTVLATAIGGTPPYTYIWDDPGTSSNSTINGLAAGTYSVTLTDAGSCTAITSVTLAALSAPSLSMSSTNLSCYGDTNGTASGLVSGGTSPYTYLWSNGQVVATLTGLTAGAYTLTVTDGSGCIVIDSTSILEPPLLSLSTSNTGASCNIADGSASVFASGGSPPYLYQWDGSGSQTTSTATGLIAAVYGVTVTDANGCIETESEIVNNIGAPSLTTSKQDALCKGSSDGWAMVIATGGLPPYTYQWNDPLSQTNVTAAGLAANTYVITVTDASGCIVSETLTIDEPAEALVLTMSYVNVTSSIICDGTASANPSGGTVPYAYSWSDPMSQTTETATGLCIGFYNVSVTDANGCVSDGTIYVDSITMGINKIENIDQLYIYPNPTTGILTIEGVEGIASIYDIYGRLILTSNTNTLDISNAAMGIYFVRVIDGQRNVYVGKILKE